MTSTSRGHRAMRPGGAFSPRRDGCHGRLLLLGAALTVTAWAIGASAQDTLAAEVAPTAAGAAGGEQARLLVATRHAPPFSFRSDDGAGWTGITHELLIQLAEAVGRDFRLVENGLEEMITAAADGEIDAAAAALTVTADREVSVDFTHPFYTSGIGVAVQRQPAFSLFGVVERFGSTAFLEVTLALLAVLALVGALIWLAERQRNDDQFPREPVKGIASGLWWSAVTMTTVGYGDKAPITVAGRLVGLVWMFASIIIISGFTAAIATSLTVNSLAQTIEGVDDLRGRRVLTVADSTSERWMDDKLIRHERVAAIGEALDALARGEAEAVVYDLPILRYLVREQFNAELRVLANQFARQDYGIALPPGSPLREPFNREILVITQSPDWRRLLQRYLGTEGE